MQDKQLNKDQIKKVIKLKLERLFGCEIQDATQAQLYQAIALIVRDEIMERRTASRAMRRDSANKKLYYLSAEFLTGRALYNNMVTLVNEKAYFEAFDELGIDKSLIFEQEPEPGLGNGGLGRLAACFLDSLAALHMPATGCTIRYEYGLFRQKIVDGYQVELPDSWLDNGNLWEIPCPDETEEVHFGGRVEEYEEGGETYFRHVDYKTVLAVPYEMPVVGYDSSMVNMLRMWSARSPKKIDMASFNRGQYVQAMEEKELAEVISKVLYPEDNHVEGKELRLKQQYFFSSATVQYAVKDFVKTHGTDFRLFPEKVALHVNDTHPGLAIPELMHILVDDYHLTWEMAEDITRRSFAYTNHTVLQEALERWPEDIMQRLLPRIYMILQEMNRRLCDRLWHVYTGQWERIGRMAIIGYGQVHMANLCVSMCHTVNGVSQIHADILRRDTFRDYCLIDPSRFLGITNGITHRRWLMQANPTLTSLINDAIGEGWKREPERLTELNPFANDASFRTQFDEVKVKNKLRLTDYMQRHQNIILDPDSIFDVQAKRMHEYKRQLMNALSILMQYNRLVEDPKLVLPKRTFIFGAKAAPGFYRAKLIIRLINAIADLVKKHPRASQFINVVFLENYCASAAEVLMPAAEVSEQISTAGKEASGTGNMKFMMNGALTIGTMDGANVEIFEHVGNDNIYIFGLSAEEVEAGYATYRASEIYETNVHIRRAMEQLIDGTLCPDNPRLFQDLYHALLFGDGGGMADPYFVLKDLPDYNRTQQRMLKDYQDRDKWLTMAVKNTANSGYFSSDRTIKEYNDLIWHLTVLDL
ncbi:glycogen/starch/alpha-glucan phosphorylase [Eubacteriales bacterium OttesenSCG-928-N13]|nr:glycogen/starch/alpha-glucan phosphorylase [Eubacteriales bacterium OttesenSCG-928-N13]